MKDLFDERGFDHSVIMASLILFPIIFLFAWILKELVDSPGMKFSHDLNMLLKKQNQGSESLLGFCFRS